MKLIYLCDDVTYGEADDAILLIKDHLQEPIKMGLEIEILGPRNIYRLNYYDVLAFDYGGMSWNIGILEDYIREFARLVTDCPSREFWVTSSVGGYYVEECMRDLGYEEAPANLHFGRIANYCGEGNESLESFLIDALSGRQA